MLNIKIKGLDEAIQKLKQLESNARNLTGLVNGSDLFTREFMQRYTNVGSFDALLDASGFSVKTKADFEAIPDAAWEETVKKNTSFSSWLEMQEKAVEQYAKEKLNEGL